jgi:hypothetical protein
VRGAIGPGGGELIGLWGVVDDIAVSLSIAGRAERVRVRLPGSISCSGAWAQRGNEHATRSAARQPHHWSGRAGASGPAGASGGAAPRNPTNNTVPPARDTSAISTTISHAHGDATPSPGLGGDVGTSFAGGMGLGAGVGGGVGVDTGAGGVGAGVGVGGGAMVGLGESLPASVVNGAGLDAAGRLPRACARVAGARLLRAAMLTRHSANSMRRALTR